jgi:peptide/nickel transport system permease protein
VKRLWRDRRAVFGATVLVLVALMAVAAPLVSSGHPAAQPQVVALRFLPPLARDPGGRRHVLGTDRFGRDVWTRLVYGARISLAVGGLAVLLSLALGVAVGGVAGFWPGPPRVLLLALTDFALALPRVVLLLLVAALWQPSAALVIVVLGLTGWMTVARLVHGEVRALAVRPFVASAVALGLPRLRVLVRHILPNALTPVIVAAALGLGNAIMLEAGLSFLGLGVQPPTPSWGNMIASGRDTLVNAPWVAGAPGLVLVLVVVACTLLGDAIQEALEPGGGSPRGAHAVRPVLAPPLPSLPPARGAPGGDGGTQRRR